MQPNQPPFVYPAVPTAPAPVFDPVKAAAREKRRSARRAANFASGAVLIFFGCSLLFSIVMAVLFLALGSDSSFGTFYAMMDDLRFSLLINSFFQALFMTLPFALMYRCSGEHLSGTLGYDRPIKGRLAPALVIGMGGMMVANFVNTAFASMLGLFGILPTGGVSLAGNTSLSEFLITALTAAVVPALFEEFAYRGVVFTLLRKKIGTGAAVFVSALLFGAMHGNLEQIPFAFIGGLVFGWVRVYTGSIWATVLLHFANNFFSATTDILVEYLPADGGYIVAYGLMLLFLIAGLVTVLRLVRRDGSPFALPQEADTYPLGEGIGVALSAPCTVLALVAFGLQMLFTQIGGLV